jgi:hypothetical protein
MKNLMIICVMLFSFKLYAQQVSVVGNMETVKCHNLKDLQAGVQILNKENSKNVTVIIDAGTYTSDNFQLLLSNNSNNTKLLKCDGEANLTGYFAVVIKGRNIHISNISFTRTNILANGSGIVTFSGCYHCGIDYCKFAEAQNGTETKNLGYYILLDQGGFNTIEKCRFENKYYDGGIICLSYVSKDEVRGNHFTISDNYFGPRAFGAKAANFALRLGSSGDPTNETSTINAYITVSNNTFDNYDAYTEIISNKSSSNRFINNTFNSCAGYISLRSGSRCFVGNNRFIGDGKQRSSGVFTSGPDDTITNNYFENLKNAAIFIVGGTIDMKDILTKGHGTSLYYDTNNLQIIQNTFTNVSPNIVFLYAKERGENYDVPQNCRIEKNIFNLPGDKDLIFYSYANPKLTPESWKQIAFDDNLVKTKTNKDMPKLNNLGWDVKTTSGNQVEATATSAGDRLKAARILNKRSQTIKVGFDGAQ